MEIIQYRMEQDRQYKNKLLEEQRYEYPDNRLLSPESIDAFARNAMHLDRQPEEKVVVIAFAASMAPVGIFEVSHGTIRSALVSPAVIFRRLLLINAACYAVIHCHPSGDVDVSEEDWQITEQLKAASEIMDLPIIDHIIVGDDYYSFKESSGIL
ncbi:MAG: DNA repair protein RadC [Clostridiales bacterium]|nr:DNA repair protein RadC [Clostridiales bacterium]